MLIFNLYPGLVLYELWFILPRAGVSKRELDSYRPIQLNRRYKYLIFCSNCILLPTPAF